MGTRWFALAIALAAVVTVSTGCDVLCVERRHESGILIVCREKGPGPVEQLSSAAGSSWSLVESHPDDLGLPWPDVATGEMVMRVTGPAGEAAVQDWIAGRAVRVEPKGTFAIPRPEVPVRVVTVDRSFRKLVDIQQAVTPPKGMPDADAIYAAGPDPRRSAVIIIVDRHSDALFRALAARYGTEAIVVLIDPARPRLI